MPEQLGTIIKAYRERNNLSLREFSGRCGISKSYLATLEKGISRRAQKPLNPSTKTISAIADAMKVDREEMLSVLGIEIKKQKFVWEPATKPEPFQHIPITQKNFEEAVRESRFILLPFRPPRVYETVYLAVKHMDGYILPFTVTKASGGTFRAHSISANTIEFSLFDIERSVFLTEEGAEQEVIRWRKGLGLDTPEEKSSSQQKT